MGNIVAAQTGNFSSPPTWVGGVVPGPGDTAQITGAEIVTIDVDLVDTYGCDALEKIGSGHFLITDTSVNVQILSADIINSCQTPTGQAALVVNTAGDFVFPNLCVGNGDINPGIEVVAANNLTITGECRGGVGLLGAVGGAGIYIPAGSVSGIVNIAIARGGGDDGDGGGGDGVSSGVSCNVGLAIGGSGTTEDFGRGLLVFVGITGIVDAVQYGAQGLTPTAGCIKFRHAYEAKKCIVIDSSDDSEIELKEGVLTTAEIVAALEASDLGMQIAAVLPAAAAPGTDGGLPVLDAAGNVAVDVEAIRTEMEEGTGAMLPIIQGVVDTNLDEKVSAAKASADAAARPGASMVAAGLTQLVQRSEPPSLTGIALTSDVTAAQSAIETAISEIPTGTVDISEVAGAVWGWAGIGGRTLTSFGTLVADVAAAVKAAMEAVGSKLSLVLARVLLLATTEELDEVDEKLGAGLGNGDIAWSHYVTDNDDNPVDDAWVGYYTDIGRTDLTVESRTNSFGLITFGLTAGRYYTRAQYRGRIEDGIEDVI